MDCDFIHTIDDQYYHGAMTLVSTEMITESGTIHLLNNVRAVAQLILQGDSSFLDPDNIITDGRITYAEGIHIVDGNVESNVQLGNSATLYGAGTFSGRVDMVGTLVNLYPTRVSDISQALSFSELLFSNSATVHFDIFDTVSYSRMFINDLTFVPGPKLLAEYTTSGPGLSSPGDYIFLLQLNEPFESFELSDSIGDIISEGEDVFLNGFPAIASYVAPNQGFSAFSLHVNTPPIAFSDQCNNDSCFEYQMCTCCVSVLDNDVDPDPDNLVPVFVSGDTNYTITIDGSICYSALLNEEGVPSRFTVNYAVTDQHGPISNTVPVRFRFDPLPDPSPSNSPTPSTTAIILLLLLALLRQL